MQGSLTAPQRFDSDWSKIGCLISSIDDILSNVMQHLRSPLLISVFPNKRSVIGIAQLLSPLCSFSTSLVHTIKYISTVNIAFFIFLQFRLQSIHHTVLLIVL